MTRASRIDVVIAVHTPTRPIRRAVESVLAAGDARAIVVAHGTDPEGISELLQGLPDQRVVVEPFADGIPSPAGPFNHGLAVATAEFVTVLGSDDTLEAGSLDSALARAVGDGADAVILPVRFAGGARLDTPLARAGRARRLDVVADRLFTRTAPLALMRRALVQAHAPVFDPRFATGEDIAFTAKLWTTAVVSYHRGDAGYVIHDDAGDRVTSAASTDLTVALDAVRALAEDPWTSIIPPRTRRSLAAKMLRVHVLGSAHRRLAHIEELSEAELSILHETATRWRALSATAEASLPRSEQQLLVALTQADDAGLRRAHARATGAGRFERLVPRPWWRALDRDGVLRRYALYALNSLIRRRSS